MSSTPEIVTSKQILSRFSDQKVKRALNHFLIPNSEYLMKETKSTFKVFNNLTSSQDKESKNDLKKKMQGEGMTENLYSINKKDFLQPFEPIIKKYNELNYNIPSLITNVFNKSGLTMAPDDIEKYYGLGMDMEKAQREVRYLYNLRKLILNKNESNGKKSGDYFNEYDNYDSQTINSNSHVRRRSVGSFKSQLKDASLANGLIRRTSQDLKQEMKKLDEANEPKRAYLRELLTKSKGFKFTSKQKDPLKHDVKKMKSSAKVDGSVKAVLKSQKTLDSKSLNLNAAGALNSHANIQSPVRRNLSIKKLISIENQLIKKKSKSIKSNLRGLQLKENNVISTINTETEAKTIMTTDRSPFFYETPIIFENNHPANLASNEYENVQSQIFSKQDYILKSDSKCSTMANTSTVYPSMNFNNPSSISQTNIRGKQSMILKTSFMRNSSLAQMSHPYHGKSKFSCDLTKFRESNSINNFNFNTIIPAKTETHAATEKNALNASVDSNNSKVAAPVNSSNKRTVKNIISNSNQVPKLKIMSYFKRNKDTIRKQQGSSTSLQNVSNIERAKDIERITDLITSNKLNDDLLLTEIKSYFATYKPNESVDFFENG